MEAENVMQLFDSCWFEHEIFKKQPRSSNSSTFEPNPDFQIQEETSKPEITRILTHHTRSMSDQLSSKTSFIDGCLSPDSVLLLTPKLHTILSGKDITEENTTLTQTQESHKKKVTRRKNSRKKSSNETKSLSDLEFEELKGFMDLGFVFSEEDKDSRLVEIIPGLQRLGKKDGVVNESTVSRPYLSEAWEVLDKRERENPILMKWRIPTLSNEIDMKDNLRWWAHTVASTVK